MALLFLSVCADVVGMEFIMKKVGIITLYYKNYNYGGQLGAFALQKAISKLGFHCEQIAFKWLNEHTLQTYESAKSAEQFRVFSESIPHSDRLYTVSDIAECVDDYDIFVCGSDQIWGLPWVISDEILPCMALSFVTASKPKIAYAASMGGAEIGEERMNILAPHVNSLDFVSVREKSAVPFVETMSNGEVTHVLDPVMLLDKSEWDDIAATPPEKAYILTYDLRDIPAIREYAEALSKKYGYEIISLATAGAATVGPKEFVGYIKHAKYFITSAFHGAVFSILFKVPFLVFPVSDNPKDPKSMDSRLIALLDTFGLSNCYVFNKNDIPNIEDITFHHIDEVKTSAFRHDSIQFLKGALET
ncbi:polysaccharide pyruvyl transferase family protein [Paenibacillus sp. FSL H8-0332]|uniref:polysaccharide pyruvyl transferase family protein n=1 Tax=Paenibacillus sp. FSL H8-0332 TaxID=2954742 RepID=UPI0030D61BDD